MSPRVIACRASRDYTLWLRFSDGLQGTVNCAGLLDIGCFKFWRDVDLFLEARPHPDTGDAWWPAGVRLDREILYLDLRGRGARPLKPAGDRAFQRFMRRATTQLDGPEANR